MSKAHKVQIKNCPFCGGTEFVEGLHSGYGAISGTQGLLLWQNLHHIICLNCGSVVHSYVDDPQKLLRWRDRK